MEEDGEEEEGLPEFEGAGAGAGGDDLEGAVGGGDGHVDGVETQRGAGVQVEVDVVDLVEAPEEREFVGQDVPEIDAVIEHEDGGGVAGPGGQREALG